MGEIALSMLTRNSLLAVADTKKKLDKTQRHLESGKAVNSAVDDAVKFFQSKGLSERAQDFIAIKQGMDQGISMIRTGVVGLTAAGLIYRQMKGLVQQAKTADQEMLTSLSVQWKDLLSQLGPLATDSSYKGDQPLMPDPNPYPATFDANTYWSYPKEVGKPPIQIPTSPDGTTVDHSIGALPTYDVITNLVAGGTSQLPGGGSPILNPANGHYYLFVSDQTTYDNAKKNADSMVFNGMQGYLATITSQPENDFIPNSVTPQKAWIGASDLQQEGNWKWIDGPESGTPFYTGTYISSISLGYNNWRFDQPDDSQGNEDGGVINWNAPGIWNDWPTNQKLGYVVEFSGDYMGGTTTSNDPNLVSVANYLDAPVDTNKSENWCDKAISYVNSMQSGFGQNITSLQNKISFTGSYVNTLSEGSDKLILADLAQEGANLVALQTRSQVAMQSMSIARLSQQDVLTLFK